MRVFIASILIWGSAALAHAAELDLPNSKLIVGNDPCRVETTVAERTKRVAPIQVSRRSAVYVVSTHSQGLPTLADACEESSRSGSIRGDLYGSIIGPIYRAHPDMCARLNASVVVHAKGIPRNPRDIGRASASRLNDEITRLAESSIVKARRGQAIERSCRRERRDEGAAAASSTLTAELSFAGKVALDA